MSRMIADCPRAVATGTHPEVITRTGTQTLNCSRPAALGLYQPVVAVASPPLE
jgi:hypothetical protein